MMLDRIRNASFRNVAWVLTLAVAWVFLFAANSEAQRLPQSRRKNGVAVKYAFRQVVAKPGQSTVRIMADDRDVALGAIVAADGYVLTKASELKGEISCRLQDGRRIEARIVGIHADFDLAMLKIEARQLPPIEWNTAGDPAVGQWLATPGLKNTPVAVGVLSVQRRRIPKQRGILGILISKADHGPRIIKVVSHSGADQAGLKVGDIITHAAGNVVKTEAALIRVIGKFRPGETLTLQIVRGESKVGVRATLGYPLPTLLSRSRLMSRMSGKLSARRADFPIVLQHDTVLSPQNCGGPVVDLSGKAVGINIARAARTETYAIPADRILRLLDDLKSGKLAPPAAKSPSTNERAGALE